MRLTSKFVLVFCTLSFLLTTLFWLLSQQLLQRSIQQQTANFAEVIAKQTADSVTELVLANDLLGLKVVLSQLAQQPGFISATITDVDQQILASTLAPGQPAPTQGLLYRAPISVQDSVAGQIILELDSAFYAKPTKTLLYYYAAITAGGLALAALLSWLLCHAFASRLTTLLNQTAAVAVGEQGATISIDGSDEISELQQQIANVLDNNLALQEQLSIISVPELDTADTNLHRSERRMATLLAIEVVNSSAAVELLHPATLATLLQQYQFYLRQAARLYRGVITQVTGDQAIVAFDIRHCQDEHAFNALCCGQLFLQLMQRLAEQQLAKNTQALQFHLAIHSGDVYFSSPWQSSKLNSDMQRAETMIGNSVTLTQELLTHAEPNTLLVSELSYDLANGNLRFPTEPGHLVQTDRRSILTYTVAAACGTHSDVLNKQCLHILPDPAKTVDPIPTLTTPLE